MQLDAGTGIVIPAMRALPLLAQNRVQCSLAALLILLLGLLSLFAEPREPKLWLTPALQVGVLALGAAFLAVISGLRSAATLLALVAIGGGVLGLSAYLEAIAWPEALLRQALLGAVAIVVMLSGLATILLARWTSARRRGIVGLSAAAAVAVVGIAALLFDLFAAQEATGAIDPVFEGILIVLVAAVALALAALAGRRAARRDTGRHWLVVPTVLGLAAIALALAFFLRGQELQSAEAAADAALQRVADPESLVLATVVRDIQRMGIEWSAHGRPTRTTWMTSARLLIRDHDELISLGWTEGGDLPRWLLHEGDHPGADLATIAAVRATGAVGEPSFYGPLTLPDGSGGVLIAVPLHGIMAGGHLVGVLRLEPMLERIAATVAPGYRIYARPLGPAATGAPDESAPDGERHISRATLALNGARWELTGMPRTETLEQALTRLPGIVLLAGMILAVLGGMTVHQAESTRLALRRLTREVRRRSRTEQALRRHRRELEARVAERTADLARKQEELEAANQHLEYLATTDGLTGLYNRRHFLTVVDAELRGAHRYGRDLALVLFDLEDFKAINDAYGHRAGDAVLEGVARIAAAELRDADCLARYGGEEFILLLPETGGAEAETAAERLRARLAAEPIRFEGMDHYCTASFGVTALRRDGDDSLEALLQRVDEALYSAKNAGRNTIRRL